MDRPPSIRKFERLWWGSTLLWGLGTALGWGRTMDALNARPQTAQVSGLALWGNVVVVLALSLLLWWLAARRGSTIGRWLVVAAAAMSGVRIMIVLIGLSGGSGVSPWAQGCFLLSAALTIWSTTMLFRPDARPWFGEVGDDGRELLS